MKLNKIYPALIIALPLLGVAAFGSANGGLASAFATDGYGGQPGNCPDASSMTLSPTSETVSPGQSIDFSGRNFAHEQDIIVYMNGVQTSKAHADGGGNFTTGSLSTPTTAGTYTYTFVGTTCNTPISSTITVSSNGSNPGTGTGTSTGTSTPPSNGFIGTVSPSTQTVSAGSSIDFGGRNFGHEETVNVSINGTMIASAHADGGGNFSTGSINVPSTRGSYTYTFIGSSSQTPVTSTMTVQ